MLPQIRLRWKEYFDWLGNLPFEKIEPRSKSFFSREYIESKKSKLHDTCFLQSSNEEITAMMLDFRISFVKQAKMLFMLSIPITFMDQLIGIKNSAKVVEFDNEHRITKYESNDGTIKFEGAHDHKSKRNDFVYIDDDEEEKLEVIPQKKKRGKPKPRGAILTKKKRAQQRNSDDGVVLDDDEELHDGSRNVRSNNQANENEDATKPNNFDNSDNGPSHVPEAVEDNDEEVEVAANDHSQPERNVEPEYERVEMEVEDDSDVEEVNIDTSSIVSMLRFIMDGDVTNAISSSQKPSTSDARISPTIFGHPVKVPQIKRTLTEDPIVPTSTSPFGSSNKPSTPSDSSATVRVPLVKGILAEAERAPTSAKRRCLRSIEPIGNFPLTSQVVASFPRVGQVAPIPVDVPSTSGAGPAPPVQLPPRRSVRTAAVPKESENKENVPSTSDSEPGLSSSKPDPQQQSPEAKKDNEPPQVQSAANPTAIGATLLVNEEGPRCFYFPRSHILPTGLKRSPFNGELPKDVRKKCEYSKIMRKFKIQKSDNFPEKTREGKMIASVLGKAAEKKVKTTYPGDPSQNDPEGAAVIEEFLGDKPGKKYMNKDDKEERVWSAEKLKEHMEGDKQKISVLYKDIEEKYLFAVWRQFESRIPLEYALQNLQKENYDIAAALGSICKYLKRLPQKMKNPSAAQVEYLATEFEDNREHVDLSWCQDNVMRNMHMAEIHHYYYKFRRFFECRVDNDGLDLRVACNCRQQMCRPLSYEPRYGCASCTNKLRKHKLPAEKLCLLCSTQLQMTGHAQPAENVVLDADDLENIGKWDGEAPNMSRTDFEKWLQDQKNDRYKKLRLTQEEVLMLDFEKLTLRNLAKEVTAQLQPYVLPHFSHCRCQEGLPVANPPPEIPDL